MLSRAAVLVAILLVTIGMAGCSDDLDSDVPAGKLRIATGEAGGVYYAYGTALSDLVKRDIPQLRTQVLGTFASLANIRMVDTKEAEVAFCLADAAADAVNGRGRFDHKIDMVALARLYDNYVQLVVRDDSPYNSVADLKYTRVATGADGSGTALVADRLLQVAGMVPFQNVTPIRMGLEASVQALAGKRVDAFFFSGGIPTPAIAKLAKTVPIRLVPLGDLTTKLAQRYSDLYSEASIPASAYGTNVSVPTVSVPNYLVVRRDLDERVAFALTRLLFANSQALIDAHPEGRRLAVRSAISTFPLDLHPGAVRWYRQARR